ncbi:sarcosine oxidase subunit gamma [Pseudoponticoccus marisrubri]|uniref:Sarcosine oxidase subunit gamma n=1 Tax=Pseudoponticoccus marisrubri TaxID=1685382 RepID=A0A0W7WEF8_9RHOB|nr:sarcosine oxidase subunit gamma family protein [Pseudoponticoccus marisrubri]KUF09025.1 sarcosine oxidase subunit gamma [Pseudoponticoccus marisrubri]
MSDALLPLGGAAFEGIVTIRETGPQGMIQLRGDLSDPGLAAAVEQASGAAMPAPLGAHVTGPRGLLWMSPDELMVLVPYADAARTVAELGRALGDRHALVADVSDARAHFTVEGAHLRDVLAKLTPADMRREALAPGTLRRTRLAQVAAGLWLRDPLTAQVFCFRSVAGYMFDLLSAAASEGSEVFHHRA